jgi:hypothetical protein
MRILLPMSVYIERASEVVDGVGAMEAQRGLGVKEVLKWREFEWGCCLLKEGGLIWNVLGDGALINGIILLILWCMIFIFLKIVGKYSRSVDQSLSFLKDLIRIFRGLLCLPELPQPALELDLSEYEGEEFD